jgi:hypothetical protein
VGNTFQFTGRRVMNLSQTAPPIVATALSGGSYQSGTRSIRGTISYVTAQLLVTCRMQQTGHKVTPHRGRDDYRIRGGRLPDHLRRHEASAGVVAGPSPAEL